MTSQSVTSQTINDYYLGLCISYKIFPIEVSRGVNHSKKSRTSYLKKNQKKSKKSRKISKNLERIKKIMSV